MAVGASPSFAALGGAGERAGFLASGSSLPAAPSQPLVSGIAAFVTGYSGGTATELHRLPFMAVLATCSYDGGIFTRGAGAVN